MRQMFSQNLQRRPRAFSNRNAAWQRNQRETHHLSIPPTESFIRSIHNSQIRSQAVSAVGVVVSEAQEGAGSLFAGHVEDLLKELAGVVRERARCTVVSRHQRAYAEGSVH